MSRSVRAETRQRAKDEKKHHLSHLSFATRKWEKKWVQIVDTTMKVYKWIPVTMPQDQNKKILKQLDSNQNSMSDKENSKLTNDLADDSNTCFSFPNSESGQFHQNSSDKFLFSEDSNSQSSDTIPAKKFKTSDC
ncbi:B-cell CLL/lymphoma 7 protein family member B [Chironomus tepperi]|uniref:B-cell CLL/lymphoma 7 protein family member B n=1 Tax=Chironomus tepperi TaxID=113505 RepID=UPI00391F28DA